MSEVSERIEQAISVGMYGKTTQELDLPQAVKHVELVEKILPSIMMVVGDEIAMYGAVCACKLTKPCKEQCTCYRGYMSGGCSRCATYGSQEQKQNAAERIAFNENRTSN